MPAEVTTHMEEVVAKLAFYEADWDALMVKYEAAYPSEAASLKKWIDNAYVGEILESDGFFDYDGAKASRVSSFEVINKLAKIMPNLIGGSADLSPSTKTLMRQKRFYG